MRECKHERGKSSSGQTLYQFTGICPKCGRDLDLWRKVKELEKLLTQTKGDKNA